MTPLKKTSLFLLILLQLVLRFFLQIQVADAATPPIQLCRSMLANRALDNHPNLIKYLAQTKASTEYLNYIRYELKHSPEDPFLLDKQSELELLVLQSKINLSESILGFIYDEENELDILDRLTKNRALDRLFENGSQYQIHLDKIYQFTLKPATFKDETNRPSEAFQLQFLVENIEMAQRIAEEISHITFFLPSPKKFKLSFAPVHISDALNARAVDSIDPTGLRQKHLIISFRNDGIYTSDVVATLASLIYFGNLEKL